MAAIYETAYPRFKPYFTEKELVEVFSLTSDEILFLNKKTKTTNRVSRLGLAILLKCYQYLGRAVKVADVSIGVRNYVAQQLSITADVDLLEYPNATYKNHKKAVLNYLGLSNDRGKRRTLMKSIALSAAQTKENLADIINRVIEEIFRQKFELPAYQSLVRLARAARTTTNNGYYQKIHLELNEEQKQVVDRILSPNDDKLENEWTWFTLKQEPRRPTSNNVKSFICHVDRLKKLQEQLYVDLEFISPARLEHLRDEAMITDQSDMRKIGELKRYSLVIILIHMKLATAIDDLVQVLTVWVRKIENKAKQKYDAYQLEQAEQTNALIFSYYKTLLIIEKKDTPKEKMDAIEQQLGGKLSELIEKCRQYLGLTGDKHLSWLLKPYNNKRSLLFKLLETISVFSATEDKSVEVALRFIKHHRSTRKDWIKITENDQVPVDLTLLSQPWFKLVTGCKKGDVVTKIHKRYYEAAVFHALSGDLSCGDAYVKDAYVYDDPNKQFICWEEFYAKIEPVPKPKITIKTM